jgi:hypothetical protein
MIRVIPLVLLNAVLACAQAPTLPPPLAPGHRILFVGNSLTYTNGLPATVAAIAVTAGDTLQVTMAAGPDLALIDHLNGATNAVQLLHDSAWDYVVLQQGPTSTTGICRDSLILWTRMFDPKIRAAHGQPALFMTWPAIASGDVWTNARESFRLAAAAVGGVFLPAGEAWHIALGDHPGLPLYGPDGFHPSPMGSFLAALEIYERLSGRDVRTLPPQAFADGVPFSMSADTVGFLQQAAHQANTAYPASSSMRPASALSAGPGGTGGRC